MEKGELWGAAGNPSAPEDAEDREVAWMPRMRKGLSEVESPRGSGRTLRRAGFSAMN
jgi:hypothetical protein